ncbi:MAG TPA: hypothetical protein VKA68_02925 [bacterium]|nr:hypothetical protein [bacterium]
MVGKFIEKYFIVFLLIALALGLYLPLFDKIPSQVLLVLLGTVIFFSSFQITLSEIRAIRPSIVFIFYAARFLILPAALYLFAMYLLPAYAAGIFLLALIPAGTASPGIAHIHRGNISLSLLIVIVSSLLAPLVLPFVLAVFTGRSVPIDVGELFLTLSVTIFLPVVLHLLFRRNRALLLRIREINSPVVVLLVCAMIMVIIGKQRSYIFEHLQVVPEYLFISLATFLLFYVFGWAGSFRSDLSNRISFAIGSGVNNTALGIVISFLYFPTQVSTFLVISEIPWIIGIMLFQGYLNRQYSVS